MRFAKLSAMVLAAAAGLAQAEFTQPERDQVVAYWSAPGRYTVSAPKDVEKVGPWQVRLTPEGSLWLWNYNRSLGLGKTPPTQLPPVDAVGKAGWEKWVEARVVWDRWFAAASCYQANLEALGKPVGTVPSQPPDPGPIPPDLEAFLGAPPPFHLPAAPLRHTVQFDDGTQIVYHDNTPMRHRYAYYRFPAGVMYGGTSVRQMPAAELDALFAEAGIPPAAAKAMRAVSLLEGGFDSVNTYDTGFVSVGFLQFACLSGGSGSLGSVLKDHRDADPAGFQADFRRFGIEVDDNAVLMVVDPATGGTFRGPDAAARIIADKRLIAVFQRAGAKSRSFRMAQLRVANNQYYPADDAISLEGMGGILYGRVSDFIKSEAGMATLMDRKVNTGKTDPLLAIAGRLAKERAIKEVADLAAYEREIVEALRYRKDYLADPALSQPPASPIPPRPGSPTSRSGGARNKRSK